MIAVAFMCDVAATDSGTTASTAAHSFSSQTLLFLSPSAVACLVFHAITVTLTVTNAPLVRLQDHNLVSLPLRFSPTQPAKLVTMTVLRRFGPERNFPSMCGVIAQDSGSNSGAKLQILLRGPPHEVLQLLPADAVPADCDQVRC